jgi:hypothetical protein
MGLASDSSDVFPRKHVIKTRPFISRTFSAFDRLWDGKVALRGEW